MAAKAGVFTRTHFEHGIARSQVNNLKRHMVRIIAHLMGDGSVTYKDLRYHNKNEQMLEEFRKDMIREFGEIHFTMGKVNSGTSFINTGKRDIIKTMHKYAKSYRSGDIEIPKDILNGHLELKKEFLRAFFDDEGTTGLRVYKKTNEIKRDVRVTSKSLKIIKQMKKILENELDIKCNKIYNDKKVINEKIYVTWALQITGRENLKKFQKEVNFNHREKKVKLNTMIKSYKYGSLAT